jgi:hypothetical protein
MDVVAAYVEARSLAGLSTDQRSRSILGRYAKQLILAGGWDRATIIEAAERFATSRRHPRFFAEWVASLFNAQTLAEHEERKSAERTTPTKSSGLRSLADILGTAR